MTGSYDSFRPKLTLIGPSDDITDGGTWVPHSLVKRWNDEYVWIGMIPGMMGTLMPDTYGMLWNISMREGCPTDLSA